MTSTTGFAISNFKEYRNSTLQGFFDLTLPSGMVISGWSYHIQGDKRWISPPAKEFPKGKYTPIIEIPDESKRAKFQECAIAAMDHYLAGAK